MIVPNLIYTLLYSTQHSIPLHTLFYSTFYSTSHSILLHTLFYPTFYSTPHSILLYIPFYSTLYSTPHSILLHSFHIFKSLLSANHDIICTSVLIWLWNLFPFHLLIFLLLSSFPYSLLFFTPLLLIIPASSLTPSFLYTASLATFPTFTSFLYCLLFCPIPHSFILSALLHFVI